MSNESVFLRSNAIIEPLADGFYAWAPTVAPLQAAMNLALAQVPLLEQAGLPVTEVDFTEVQFSASTRGAGSRA